MESLLFRDQETWMKKGGELFALNMGAYDDAAEIFELVEISMVYKFQQLNKINNFDLYKDDGLAVVKNINGPQSEKAKKKLQILFKEFGFKGTLMQI